MCEARDGALRTHYLEALIRGPRGSSVESPNVLFEYARRKNRAAEVDRALAVCFRGGFRQALLRGDTDFSQTEHLDRWDADGRVRFVFGYDAAPNLIALAEQIPPRCWQPLRRAPHALDEAPLALRRIGWVGRPIILAGSQVAGRALPQDEGGREQWVRAEVGPGAYSVVAFDEPAAARASDDGATVDTWSALREAHGAGWLVTNHGRQVEAARRAGLMTIVVGPPDPQPRLQRPDYQARDLRDAVGHLMAMDVFSDKPIASMLG